MFASILQCFDAMPGQTKCIEVMACSTDKATCFVITLGDSPEGDPLTILLKQPGNADAVRREVRVSDTLKVVLRETFLYLKDGTEHFLMNVDICSIGRRCLQLAKVHGTTVLFFAMNSKLFRFTTCSKLQFAVEYHDNIACISRVGDGRMAVLLVDGTIHMISIDTGCTVLSRKHLLLPHERAIAVTASANGVFWLTNQQLTQLIILRSESQDSVSFMAPFMDRMYFESTSVQMPKEYDAMPWRMSCSTTDQRHFSVAGRFGFCVNQRRVKWTILHPDAQPLVLVDSMQFIDADLLLISCTAFDKTKGRRFWELRIYSVNASPIAIVFRATLNAQCKIVTVNRDKSICVVDVKGKLSLYKCALNAGWAVEASADLQSALGIRRILYLHQQFLILKDCCVYNVRLSSIMSDTNPIACTVASIWEGERVEELWQLEHNIVALLVFREQCWKMVFRLYEHVLCQLQVDPPIYNLSIESVNDAVIVLPQILIYFLRNGMKALVDAILPNVFAMLEPCLFEAWRCGLAKELLTVLPLHDCRVLLSIARVARTLEYRKAIEFVAIYGHSLKSLFGLFLTLRSCEGLLLLFKLCVEDDSVDWVSPTIDLLLESYQLEDVQQVFELATKLNLPCSIAKQAIEVYANKAFNCGNLFDLRQYEAILGDLKLAPATFDPKSRKNRLIASMVLDPSIVEWAEGNPKLQSEVRVLYSLDY